MRSAEINGADLSCLISRSGNWSRAILMGFVVRSDLVRMEFPRQVPNLSILGTWSEPIWRGEGGPPASDSVHCPIQWSEIAVPQEWPKWPKWS